MNARMALYALPLALFGGCAAPPTAQQQQVLRVLCQVDGAIVPVAQPVVATLGPSGATAVALDAALVHPAVVAACAQLGGVPAGVAPSVAAAIAPVAGVAAPAK